MSSTDHHISWEEAGAMTRKYRESITPGACIAVSFDKESLMSLLEQSDCKGIRFYFALTQDSSLDLVLAGMDSSGNDLTGPDRLCMNHGVQCPNFCSSPNILNS